MMKKWIVCLLCVMMLCACTFKKSYKITLTGDEDLVDQCPSRARENELVTITTMTVCDGDLYISVDGRKDFGTRVNDSIYTFIMPSHDVEVHVWVIGNGLAHQDIFDHLRG